jgi:hypothetical protein
MLEPRVVERMYFEFGENDTDDTGEEVDVAGSSIVFRHWPVRVSQIRLVEVFLEIVACCDESRTLVHHKRKKQ